MTFWGFHMDKRKESKDITQLKVELANNNKQIIMRKKLNLTNREVKRLLLRQWKITKILTRDE